MNINTKLVSLLLALVVVPFVLFAQRPLRIDTHHYASLALTSVAIRGNTAIACGDMGVIVKTTNVGEKWSTTSRPLGDTVLLNDVAWANSSVACCVGTDGAIVVSTNDGTTWQRAMSNTRENLLSVAFDSSQRLVSVGTNGTSLLSVDRGQTWTLIPIRSGVTLHNVMGLPAGGFLAVGDGGTIATLSAGSSVWSVRSTNSQATFYSCHFATDQLGVVGIAGGILATTNAGQTWTQVLTGVNGSVSNLFAQANTVVACGAWDGTMYSSKDGSKWTSTFVGDSTAVRAGAFHPTQPNTTIIVGDDGMVRSVDFTGSNSAELGQYKAPYYFDVLHGNDGVLWCVGTQGAVDRFDATQWTYKTMTAPSTFLTGIARVGAALCVSDIDGSLWLSVDGGSTWVKKSLPVASGRQRHVRALAGNGKFWCIDQGTVFMSVDGETWQAVWNVSSVQFYDVEAIDATTAFVCGSGGYVARTTDGGSTWSPISTNTTVQIHSIAGDGTGGLVAVGELGTILAMAKDATAFSVVRGPASLALFTCISVQAASGRMVVGGLDGKVHIRSSLNAQWVTHDLSMSIMKLALHGDTLTCVGEGGSVFRSIINQTNVYEEMLVPMVLITPNPATESISVSVGNLAQITSIEIHATDGTLLRQVSMDPQSQQLTIDVKGISPGAYTLTLRAQQGNIVGRGRFVRL